MDLERRGIQESWLIFTDLRLQEWSITMSRKSSKGGRKSVWMNKEFLT